MPGYIGAKAVSLSTTAATVSGDVKFDGMLNNDDSVDADVTIASGRNAMVIGPVTINATTTINGTFTVV